MAGIMLDSTNPGAVIDAVRERREWRGSVIRAAALYIDGKFPAPAAAITALRSRVAVVEITVQGTVASGVAKVKAAGDVEPEDLTPATGAEWALSETQRGAYPVLYSDRSEKAEVIAECTAQGMTAGKSYGLWVATLDGTFTDTDGSDLRTQPGVVAVQCLSAAMLGIDADASVLTRAGEAWLQLPTSWQEHAADLATRLAELLRENA